MRGHKLSDEDRLYHIRDAIQFILSATAELNEDLFYKDEILKRAVVRDLEVIGEAANSISNSLKEQYPQVPWRQIVATRHRIIHEYFHVSYVMVWAIVQTDLPDLQDQINKILKELS